MISELLEHLPEEQPGRKERTGYGHILELARTALSCNLPGLAKTLFSVCEVMVSDRHLAGYHLAAARLWSTDSRSWHEAYCQLLKAEEAAPASHPVHEAMVELEMALAERFSQFPPLAGFFRSMLRRHPDAFPDRTLRRSWSMLRAMEPERRALVAVQIIAAGRVQGQEIGEIESARRYLAAAGPECSDVLRRVVHWIGQLHQWERLTPITTPWLAVIEAVIQDESR